MWGDATMYHFWGTTLTIYLTAVNYKIFGKFENKRVHSTSNQQTPLNLLNLFERAVSRPLRYILSDNDLSTQHELRHAHAHTHGKLRAPSSNDDFQHCNGRQT